MVVALAVVVLAGCGTTPQEDPAVAGARDAVEAYVAAIEDGDLDAATSMTDPVALVAPDGRTPPVDVTAALPNAIEPMADAWITYDGLDFTRVGDEQSTTDVVRFTVSYVVAGIAGADSVEVTRMGDDAGAVEDWLVTDALVTLSPSFVDAEVAESSFGGVTFETRTENAHNPVWGYPGIYEHAAVRLASGAPVDATVPPVEVAIGVELGRMWDESLRILEVAE